MTGPLSYALHQVRLARREDVPPLAWRLLVSAAFWIGVANERGPDGRYWEPWRRRYRFVEEELVRAELRLTAAYMHPRRRRAS